MDIKERIIRYICDELNDLEVMFKDHDSLYDLGVLDSLKVFQLITYIGVEFGISIDPSDLAVEDFETVNNILQFIERVRIE